MMSIPSVGRAILTAALVIGCARSGDDASAESETQAVGGDLGDTSQPAPAMDPQSAVAEPLRVDSATRATVRQSFVEAESAWGNPYKDLAPDVADAIKRRSAELDTLRSPDEPATAWRSSAVDASLRTGVPQHGEKMTDATRRDEQVPDHVTVPEALPGEEQDASRVAEPARNQPRQPGGPELGR